MKLLLQHGHCIDMVDAVGFSALHVASYFGHTTVIDVLLRNSANINLAGEVGDRPLHMACYSGHLEAVQQLLQGDAAADGTHKHGYNTNTCLSVFLFVRYVCLCIYLVVGLSCGLVGVACYL